MFQRFWSTVGNLFKNSLLQDVALLNPLSGDQISPLKVHVYPDHVLEQYIEKMIALVVI